MRLEKGHEEDPRISKLQQFASAPLFRPSVAGRRRPRPGQLDHFSEPYFDGVAVKVPLAPEEDEGSPCRTCDRWGHTMRTGVRDGVDLRLHEPGSDDQGRG